jgi:hypothetical protein
VVDKSIFLGSLLVAGIAGLTLTSAVFQLPNRYAQDYKSVLKGLLANLKISINKTKNNPFISYNTRNDINNMYNRLSRQDISPFNLNFILPIIRIRSIDFWEIFVAFLFIVMEVFVLLIYCIIPDNANTNTYLDPTQLLYLNLAYISLMLAIFTIFIVHVIGVYNVSVLPRYTTRFIEKLDDIN